MTLMAATSDDGSHFEGGEHRIATKWHRACPTLRTIILPHGKVWFNDRERDDWKCLDGREDRSQEPEPNADTE
jgi:hypothetical protein